MHLRIEDNTVRRNVEIFKIILKKLSHDRKIMETESKNISFKAYLHRLTGEMRFEDLSLDPLDPPEWSVIHFEISLPGNRDEEIFDLIEKEESAFSFEGIHTQAMNALKQTISTVKCMSRLLPKLQDLSAICLAFSQMSIDSALDNVSTPELLKQFWHPISREECESILLLKKPGSFLFRKDEFAKILETQLSMRHGLLIECITLSILDLGCRVVDCTLVHAPVGWVIYNDDPSLEGQVFPSARALLESLSSQLSCPVLIPS